MGAVGAVGAVGAAGVAAEAGAAAEAGVVASMFAAADATGALAGADTFARIDRSAIGVIARHNSNRKIKNQVRRSVRRT